MKNIRKILALVLALACMMSLSVAAFATDGNTASTTLADGTYTITANLYVAAGDNEVNGENAYLTNSFVMPLWAVSDNATLVVANGVCTVTVPVVNTTFALIEMGTTSNAGVTSTSTTTTSGTYGDNDEYTSRIDNVIVTVTEGTTGIYYTGCHEYSTYYVSVGDKYFNLTLDINWSSATAK